MQDFIQNNTPEIWLSYFPRPSLWGHKYDRGHALVYAAPELTGATRLAASACSRIGAGLVSVIAAEKADVYRATLPADIIVKEDCSEKLKNVSAVLGGSGGINAEHQQCLLKNTYDSARIFDAGAIPSVQDFHYLDNQCVLTPHEGEFLKAFPKITGESQEKALEAAKLSGAYIILKGPKTIIASPDGRIVLNDHASAYLAKAGTGDVLAGMVVGLIAQQMPIFEVCCCAVWIHGEASLRFGPGLVASDIPNMIPLILSELLG